MVNSIHSDTPAPKKDRKSLNMSGRSRPRAHNKDEGETQHEEAHIWSRIVPELKALAVQSNLAQAQAEKIKKEEERFFGIDGTENNATMNELNSLRELETKQLEQAVKEQAQLQSLIERVNILAALRESTEGAAEKPRFKKTRIPLGDNDSRGEGSTRVKPPRSMSASADPPRSEPIHLQMEVAYRLPKNKGLASEMEWIQCNVINIIGEGPKKRYEVQDPEPDEGSGHGKIFRAHLRDLIPIPKDSANLPQYPVGKHVLARYPETTTFYRAEVMGTKRDGTCRLKFEGEEEVNKEQEVERRLVLDYGGK
ncbi:hypothetical protein BJ508DRAFT_414182 [Ascobolus immersus RN42]|uniref:SGF29 C-terminal domain-containing protein n=1 Tax=Ascobolus immersus RN42 TaxID=1160509 RepID=A0A3N4I8E0_ASCIM|nr:hypothetical protein BJ508DRAFT_414182 [Ascobolus immersus RN42]